MKKLITASIVILSVGLAMVIVGGILQGVDWASTGTYDGSFLAIHLLERALRSLDKEKILQKGTPLAKV